VIIFLHKLFFNSYFQGNPGNLFYCTNLQQSNPGETGGTYFIARFYWEPFFLATNSQQTYFP
jgi:hypothetical protein